MKNVLLSLLCFVLATPLFAQYNPEITQKNCIDVNGTAEMEVVPDEIYFRINLSEEVFKGRKELEDMEQKMTRAMEKCGIDVKKDLTVLDFSSSYDYNWFTGTDVYAQKNYQLLLHDAQTMDKVFKELKDLKISNIQLIRVDHSKIEEFKKEVGKMAMKAAKEKAEYLLDAIGSKIGNVIYVSESGTYTSENRNIRVDGMDIGNKFTGGLGNSIPLDFKKIKLNSNVFVKFEIQK
ncbi:MAG: SIMPL domain-containing protein [bacterium]